MPGKEGDGLRARLEFRGLEKLFILRAWGVGAAAAPHPHLSWALLCAPCTLEKHVELCPELTDAEELARSKGLVK